ncbi:MAG: hypothetical protein MNPFHGCM_00335 [Gemmatimonadaceae bacterium]|nr:hypothetical protein [Gemmatimonadaceae bacterium]
MSPASKDWERELAKIDKQLESVSDEALFPTKNAPTPAARAENATRQRTTSTLGVALRLLLSIALGVAMMFWPYATRCGAGLFYYLGAVGIMVAAGMWSAVWSWRHRAVRAHLLSLLIVLWGGMLGAREILPRVGYAIPTEARPAQWLCS